MEFNCLNWNLAEIHGSLMMQSNQGLDCIWKRVTYHKGNSAIYWVTSDHVAEHGFDWEQSSLMLLRLSEEITTQVILSPQGKPAVWLKFHRFQGQKESL